MSAIDVGAGDSAKSEKRESKTLNDLVAVTVVILSVFMAISKTKDDNINQAMQKAKANSVDAWAEYQFARVKLHVDENGLNQLRLLESGGQIDKALAAKQAAEYEADIKKYEGRSKETRAKAERLEAEYDRLNFRDDQFDMSDVFLSIAIALAAVASLVDSFWLLYVAWGSGALGPRLRHRGFCGLEFPARMAGELAGDVAPHSRHPGSRHPDPRPSYFSAMDCRLTPGDDASLDIDVSVII